MTTFPLVSGPTVAGVRCLQPEGFPGFCYVFPMAASSLVEMCLNEMQKDNQPHNLLFTPSHLYIWPKPLQRPERSFELYPETVGGPELLGSFTVYQQSDYDRLTAADAAALCAMNTAAPVAVPVRRSPAITPARTWDGASAVLPGGTASKGDAASAADWGKMSPQLSADTSLLKFLSPVAASGWTARRRNAGGGS